MATGRHPRVAGMLIWKAFGSGVRRGVVLMAEAARSCWGHYDPGQEDAEVGNAG